MCFVGGLILLFFAVICYFGEVEGIARAVLYQIKNI